MTTTYRGAYLNFGTECTILTGPEQAGLTDDELRAEALEEAHRAALIGDSVPCLTLAEFQQRLTIGELSQ